MGMTVRGGLTVINSRQLTLRSQVLILGGALMMILVATNGYQLWQTQNMLGRLGAV